MRKYSVILAVTAGLVTAGCASQGSKSGSEGAAAEPTYTAPATTTAPATSSVVSGPSMPNDHVLYFDFDKSEIKAEGQSVVDAWAKYLAANPKAKVRLEGSCDERGTREYNVALGERRANTVQKALTSGAVGQKQLSVISYGEEHPVALGHDESAWDQNRRVEIVVQ